MTCEIAELAQKDAVKFASADLYDSWLYEAWYGSAECLSSPIQKFTCRLIPKAL